MSSDNLNRWYKLIKTIFFDKIHFWTTFWGGFAVDADFGDGFPGCIEGPKNVKIVKNR
jgi:hypothetical protein